jgi:predicted GH43/DUF377 family glycosyl hydrolase
VANSKRAGVESYTTVTGISGMQTMNDVKVTVAAAASGPVKVQRRPERFVSDDRRVIARLFHPGSAVRVKSVIQRVMGLDEAAAVRMLDRIFADFRERHRDLPTIFRRHYDAVAKQVENPDALSDQRKLLIGAYFTMEYSFESAALFNPSIVPHPDQQGVPDGCVRFLMSLRATGEGHVSSIVFRTGLIHGDGSIRFDPPAPYARSARPIVDRKYDKHLFFLKLIEMGAFNEEAGKVLEKLGEQFTLAQMEQAVERTRRELPEPEAFNETADNILWLARSNYHLELPRDCDPSEIVIFPTSDNESRGIEDVRLVRFLDDDDEAIYFGTYTAYNGFRILPQLIETNDFHTVQIHTLNGLYVQNKGMALFPRKLDGWYHMVSRLDGENMYLMRSDNVYFWNDAQPLARPRFPWQFMQIGNNGSPIETEAGWLLLTHGVGPVRQYTMGVMLLDRDDPSKIIAELDEPLLVPNDQERDGYVPNVVYSCGAMIHGDHLIIPYAVSDSATTFATVSVDELLGRLVG